ncbi:DUF3596 domain-containing protein [Pannus brasiliensis CCIBt3594]|uniref:DUF3596 domain-containing protein n=1 Tax=Pannus brasiliensis CCIBt3594 TaxID=1427578 RepID=A0AAW9QWC9_9CHRO
MSGHFGTFRPPRPEGRASKGSIRIEGSNGRRQRVFSYDGTRHYLSLGLPDSKINRVVAEAKAKIIESDIALERFNPTLAKYKPLSLKEALLDQGMNS